MQHHSQLSHAGLGSIFMKTIASGNGFSISSSFGDSVVEGTVSSGIEGVGAFLQFDIHQEAVTLRTVYIQVVPNSGQPEDFWDNFWSNYVDGEPADLFALSKFMSVEPSGSFGVYLNADTFSEGAETFSVNIYENNLDAALGYAPILSANFTVLDDDGYTGSLAISGTEAEGSTLSLSDTIADADGLGIFTYQWLRDGSAISGAALSTYVLTQDDIGENISASVSYTDGYGTVETVISAETGLVDYGSTLIRTTSTVLPDLSHVLNLILQGSGDIYGYGNANGNTVTGNLGHNTLKGYKGDDVLYGKSGNDRLYGNGNDDKLYGGSGDDLLKGGSGLDLLKGGSGNDKLYGGSGDDILKGGVGRDILRGDAGKDTMVGGGGADLFVFRKASDSSASYSKADTIKGFKQGQDQIDLHFIDASTKLSGNNAFTFDGTTSFGTSNEGDIYFKQLNNAGTAKDYTMVYIDTDSDRGTEMSIKLMGLYELTADDFIL
jgi:Ca2+-binding RTX toxin-like protein